MAGWLAPCRKKSHNLICEQDVKQFGITQRRWAPERAKSYLDPLRQPELGDAMVWVITAFYAALHVPAEDEKDDEEVCQLRGVVVAAQEITQMEV